MSNEIQTPAEVIPAPAPEVTVTSENADIAPVVADPITNVPEDEKKFSQADIDAMISKRLAREQRKWEREQQARQATTYVEPQVPKEALSIDQFETPEAYAQALAVQKAEQLTRQREVQRHHSAVANAYAEREEEARTKYDDFEQVAYNPQLRITDAMAETIRASDTGPDIAYWLGGHPKDADRISRLPPLLQAREIGKIEAQMASGVPVKKTSSAPEPIKPVTARQSNPGVTDTTDPRSVQTMSVSDWIAAERTRQIAKMQASRNR